MLNAYYAGRITRKFNGRRKKKKRKKHILQNTQSILRFREILSKKCRKIYKKDKKLRKILKDFQLGFQFPVYFQKLWTA